MTVVDLVEQASHDLRQRNAESRPADRLADRLEVVRPGARTAEVVDADLGFLIELLADPAIAWYEPLAIPATEPAGVQLIFSYIRKAADPSSSTCGWTVVEAGRRVGVCQLRPEPGGYLVGVSLEAAARSRGLGTALFKALAAFARRELNAGHTAGEVEDSNIASLRALHKAGYSPCGRYQITLDNGRRATVTRFSA